MQDFEEDRALMQRVASGDRLAQRDLVARLAPRARRVSFAMLRHSADADDVAQGALIEVLKSAHTYQGVSSVERWADRIVTRTAMRLVRERDVVREEAEQAAAPHAEGASHDVHRYLEALPEVQRTTLLLRHVMGCSIEEISETMGVPANTVKDRLVRALGQIRSMVRSGEEAE